MSWTLSFPTQNSKDGATTRPVFVLKTRLPPPTSAATTSLQFNTVCLCNRRLVIAVASLDMCADIRSKPIPRLPNSAPPIKLGSQFPQTETTTKAAIAIAIAPSQARNGVRTVYATRFPCSLGVHLTRQRVWRHQPLSVSALDRKRTYSDSDPASLVKPRGTHVRRRILHIVGDNPGEAATDPYQPPFVPEPCQSITTHLAR